MSSNAATTADLVQSKDLKEALDTKISSMGTTQRTFISPPTIELDKVPYEKNLQVCFKSYSY